MNDVQIAARSLAAFQIYMTMLKGYFDIRDIKTVKYFLTEFALREAGRSERYIFINFGFITR